MKVTRANSERIKNYEAAFEKFSGTSSCNFETREDSVDGPVLIRFNNLVYRVESDADMFNNIKEVLVNKESAAINIPLDYWIEVVGDIHLEPAFIEHLLLLLDNKEEIINLSTAISLSDHTTHNACIFWETIFSLDSMELYPKSIVAASQTGNLDSLAERLMEEMICDGENAFNQLKNGVFEFVCPDEDNVSEDTAYYIYNVDPFHWEYNYEKQVSVKKSRKKNSKI